MILPHRIVRRRTAGWRLPPNTVCVTRPGRWGNPFSNHPDGDVAMFRIRIAEMRKHERSKYCAFLLPLVGKDLACYCAACSPCHADFLIALANTPGMIALARLRYDRQIEAAYKTLGRQRLAVEMLERERRRLG